MILDESAAGKSVILVSTELTELFELADRIAVMYQGSFMGIYKPSELTTETIGLLMAGVPMSEIHSGETQKEGGGEDR